MLAVGLCWVAAFSMAVDAELARKLSWDQIVGYEPGTDVVQHSLIDLDQKEMEAHLKANDFAKAKNIYMKGGNSGGKATMEVSAIPADAPKGTQVKQGTKAVGKIKSAAKAGDTKVVVAYVSKCKEGGSASPSLEGCFTTSGGDLTVAGIPFGAPSSVAHSYRTLMGFSSNKDKLAGEIFHEDYKKYYNNDPDYAHKRVVAALDKTGICAACDDAARIEIAKKTSAYMNVWMYTIHEFEDAINDCKAGCATGTCNDDPGVHAWDEGVAFYAGSSEGAATTSNKGYLIHELADKRCKNFKTCLNEKMNDGSKAYDGSTDGGSKVNDALLKEFKNGQNKLIQAAMGKAKCADVVPIKDRIVELMSIPLVQGSLRYAYKMGMMNDVSSKSKAEGAAFSAAILPRVAKCSATAAKTISDNMNQENSMAKPLADTFKAIKEAFESTYSCMGITCADVGGLWLTEGYHPGAEPCGTGASGGGSAPAATTAAPGTTSASFELQPTLALGALLLAHIALLQ